MDISAYCTHSGLGSFLQAQEDYRGQDISGQDLSEQDLSGALFDNTTIFSDGTNGVNLSNTSGNGAYLTEQDLSGVDFRGVNLTGVNLYNANLSSATFDGTTIFSMVPSGQILEMEWAQVPILLIVFDCYDFRG